MLVKPLAENFEQRFAGAKKMPTTWVIGIV